MLVLVLVQAGCSEVYVAQRGGVTPILVLHRETGAFVRAFGRNATSQQSLTAHVHGTRGRRTAISLCGRPTRAG